MIKEENNFVIHYKYKNLVLGCFWQMCFYILFMVVYTYSVYQVPQDFRVLIVKILFLAGCAFFFSYATAPLLILRNFNKYKILEVSESGFEIQFLGFISWNEVLKIEIGRLYCRPQIYIQTSRIFKIPKKMNLRDSALWLFIRPVDIFNNIIQIDLLMATDKVNDVYNLLRKYYNKYHCVADMSEFRKSE